jgi:hypothetical protein
MGKAPRQCTARRSGTQRTNQRGKPSIRGARCRHKLVILRPALNETLPVVLVVVYNLYVYSYAAVVSRESYGWLGFPLP